MLLGMLAAFGLVCAVWILAGLLPRRPPGCLILLEGDPVHIAQRHLWLREMGLTREILIIPDCPEEARDWVLAQGIEICSREELIRRLEMGEKEH